MKHLTLEQLTAGIRERHVGKENAALCEKWSRTGLLRGLEGDRREQMARLLENQAAQVLRESVSLTTGGGSMTSSGQVQGFTSIAFPIVRRVFGGLIANELVSIQPMSLPSGLIFYIDYTYGSNVGGDGTASVSGYTKGQSIYGNPAGKGVRSGSQTAGGMWDNVGTGYSKVHSGSATISGSGLNVGAWSGAAHAWSAAGTVASDTAFSGTNARMASFDPDLENALAAGTVDICFAHIAVSELTSKIAKGDLLALDQLLVTGFATTNSATAWSAAFQGGAGVFNLRRHTKRGDWTGTVFTPNPMGGDHVQVVIGLSNGGSVPVLGAATKITMAQTDQLSIDSTTGAAVTLPSFESDFGSTPSPSIPEIDIKIESISITATSRKLKARWSPELAQDLNAYHSMDAEVELTQILSEQIALEVDREILMDLVTQANAANMYWSRSPGKFVNKVTGAEAQMNSSLSAGPRFTGNVREWYETLLETITDAGNTIHRKTLRGSANFIVTSPDVCTILEHSVAYRPKYSLDGEGQVSSPITVGCEPVGQLNQRYTVYKDPYFPRNKILIGFKGKSSLESGYVYAPYVPLIVTPTIFAPEDFTPRRGVMTRYGKQMVRSDFYATVTVLDMNLI